VPPVLPPCTLLLPWFDDPPPELPTTLEPCCDEPPVPVPPVAPLLPDALDALDSGPVLATVPLLSVEEPPISVDEPPVPVVVPLVRKQMLFSQVSLFGHAPQSRVPPQPSGPTPHSMAPPLQMV
jgi:hypothetical protein